MTNLNIHNKKFSTTKNKNGLSSNDTIFHYFQDGKTITGTYKGGEIKEGFIVGKQIADNKIELLFQCLTTNGDLKTGSSTGIISKHKTGKIQLNFDWIWLNGDLSGGTSEYIEITQ